MKSSVTACAMLFLLLYTVSPAPGIEYAIDQLEKGNPGGNAASLKTFDQKGPKDTGKEAAVDIWMQSVPEELITAGFWLSYDASKMSITKVEIYDGSTLPGPWDSAMSKQAPNPGGTGTHLVIVGNLGNVKPDKKGDVVIAKVQLKCQDKCTSPIEIKPIKGFDTVVGSNGKVFDATIKSATFAIH